MIRAGNFHYETDHLQIRGEQFMTITSRRGASLVVAREMGLAAGRGVAGPAAAGPGDGDLAAVEAAEFGEVLEVQYSHPDGFTRTTEYENATASEVGPAACSTTTSAYRPTKVSTQVRGRGYLAISGCGGGAWEVLVTVKLWVNGEWVGRGTTRHTVYSPWSGTIGASANCRRGSWITEIIVQRGNQDQSSRSTILTVSSC
jgi:hypothetical protein